MFKRLNQLTVSTAVACSIGLITFPNAQSSENDNATLNEQFDWVLYVDSSSIPNYLNYPTSQLGALDKYAVTFIKTGSDFILRGGQLPKCNSNPYEEFWYHHSRPIGQRRSRRAQMQANEQGALILRIKQGDKGSNTAAAANCLVRLFLEARLQESIVAAVIVPEFCFEQVSSDLGQLNFFPVQSFTKATDGNLTLRLLSDPPGGERHFYYACRQ